MGAAVLAGLAIVGRGSDDAASSDPFAVEAMEPVDANAEPAVDLASDPLPSRPVDRAVLRRASMHYRLATKDEGPDGAVLYSRNCYAGLKAGFSWRRLDTCGAFDAAAATFSNDVFGADAGWMDNETAAGRYLAAAIAAGMPATNADVRLAALQASATVRVRPAAVAESETEQVLKTAEPQATGRNIAADMLDMPSEPAVEPLATEPLRPPDADEGAPLNRA